VIVLIPAGDSMLIENIAVLPSAQTRGLGRQLMRFAEQRATDVGRDRLTLYTNEVMVENLAMYARLGYRETSRRPEHGYNRVFMEKRLATPPELRD
jgi:ribosomal protein S18 acetylase RimI-like enzyme